MLRWTGWRNKLGILFHFVVFLYYGYGDLVMFPVFANVHNVLGKAVDDPDILRYTTASPGFLTLWNMVVHQIYFGSCCLSHLSRAFPALIPSLIVTIADVVRRNIFASIFVPSSIMTAVNYWFMHTISPEHVYSHILVAYPTWINHCLHTFVVPIALYELYLRASSGETMEFGKLKGWLMIFGYITLYTVVNAVHLLLTGTWIYPFYDVMNNWMRAGIFVSMYASSAIYYYAAIVLGKTVWGKHHVHKRGKHLMAKRK